MSTRLFYAYKAQECVTAAARTADAGKRADLLNVAGLFMKLAKHVADRDASERDSAAHLVTVLAHSSREQPQF
jgi:hypothetical protein